MKKSIIIPVVILLIIGGFYFYKQNKISGWQTYRNKEYGFEFKYPTDWRECDPLSYEQMWVNKNGGYNVMPLCFQSTEGRYWGAVNFIIASESEVMTKYPTYQLLRNYYFDNSLAQDNNAIAGHFSVKENILANGSKVIEHCSGDVEGQTCSFFVYGTDGVSEIAVYSKWLNSIYDFRADKEIKNIVNSLQFVN